MSTQNPVDESASEYHVTDHTVDSEDSSKSDDDLLETAKKRYQTAEEYEKDNRSEALADWKFRAGDQWPSGIKSERDLEGRPTIVINRILQPLRQITNDQRQNRPSIKIHPVDDHADIETAKIYQGLIRHIEQDSNADVAYDTAFEGAAVGGLGYVRVYSEYEDPSSFRQQLKIGLVEDWASVHFDPSSKQPDGSDANFAFITVDMPREDYIAEYGESKLGKNSDWSTYGESDMDWVKKDSARVVEYFYKEYEEKKIVLLKNGESLLEEELLALAPGGLEEGAVVDSRMSRVPVIKWCKLNGVEILEKTVWPGRFIPVVPVYGDKYIINGKRHLEGIVRHAKDPQRMYNYWKSTETETITLAPKSPWLVAEGQIPKQYEQQWRLANRKSLAYLTYAPTTHDGKLVPPPQRNMMTADVGPITQAGMFAADDLKATTGIFDAAMGNQSNETSGIAIQRRNVQAQTSNFHLIDNLTRSIRHVGRILVDAIPHVYDTARAARIIGEEGDEEIVRINEEFVRKGEPVTYQLGIGKYDVSVNTGPSFATKRQEAASNMLELARTAPQVMAVASDLFVKSLDIPGGSEIAERLRKSLPPGLADNKDQKPVPPEIQAQMQQMSQMIETMTASLNEANETIKTKKLELDSREKIEAMKLETQILIEKMKQAKDAAYAEIERLQSVAEVERQMADLQAIQDREINLESPQINQPAGTPMPGAEEQL